jgi:hypothetical protein
MTIDQWRAHKRITGSCRKYNDNCRKKVDAMPSSRLQRLLQYNGQSAFAGLSTHDLEIVTEI